MSDELKVDPGVVAAHFDAMYEHGRTQMYATELLALRVKLDEALADVDQMKAALLTQGHDVREARQGEREMMSERDILARQNGELRRILRQAELALYGTTYRRHLRLMQEIAGLVPLEGAADELDPAMRGDA